MRCERLDPRCQQYAKRYLSRRGSVTGGEDIMPLVHEPHESTDDYSPEPLVVAVGDFAAIQRLGIIG